MFHAALTFFLLLFASLICRSRVFRDSTIIEEDSSFQEEDDESVDDEQSYNEEVLQDIEEQEETQEEPEQLPRTNSKSLSAVVEKNLFDQIESKGGLEGDWLKQRQPFRKLLNERPEIYGRPLLPTFTKQVRNRVHYIKGTLTEAQYILFLQHLGVQHHSQRAAATTTTTEAAAPAPVTTEAPKTTRSAATARQLFQMSTPARSTTGRSTPGRSTPGRSTPMRSTPLRSPAPAPPAEVAVTCSVASSDVYIITHEVSEDYPEQHGNYQVGTIIDEEYDGKKFISAYYIARSAHSRDVSESFYKAKLSSDGYTVTVTEGTVTASVNDIEHNKEFKKSLKAAAAKVTPEVSCEKTAQDIGAHLVSLKSDKSRQVGEVALKFPVKLSAKYFNPTVLADKDAYLDKVLFPVEYDYEDADGDTMSEVQFWLVWRIYITGSARAYDEEEKPKQETDRTAMKKLMKSMKKVKIKN